MTVGAIYTSHKNVTAILKTALFSVAHVAMLASPSLTILVSTTEAFKAPDTPSRRSAIGPCQAVGEHLQPLSAAFRPIDHVELAVEPVCERDHFDWRFSETKRVSVCVRCTKPDLQHHSKTWNTSGCVCVCVCVCVCGGQGVSDDRA